MSIAKIKRNLKISKYTSIASFAFAGCLFVFAYSKNPNIWFLLLGIVLFAACGATVFFYRYIEKKINDAINNSNSKDQI